MPTYEIERLGGSSSCPACRSTHSSEPANGRMLSYLLKPLADQAKLAFRQR